MDYPAHAALSPLRSLRYVAAATPSLLKGDTAGDIRQRVSITMIYNLPFGGASKSFVAKIVRQWKLNVLGAIQSGSPLTVSSGTYHERFNIAAFLNQPNYTWGNAGRVIASVLANGTSIRVCSANSRP